MVRGSGSDRAKVAREEKEQLKEEEMKVDVDSPQGESAEIKSSKRKMIRAESEETQDYVCGTVVVSQEEVEEFSLRAECPQRTTRINLFLRQSLQ